MKHVHRLLLAGLAAALAGHAHAQPPPATTPAACAPPMLFRTTVRNISPGVAASDPRAQPRQLFRQGSKHLRSVGQPAPNGDQMVLIVSEPDIWVVNEATRIGRHMTDRGPSLDVRAPILPPAADLPPEFKALEYGCEAAFVAKYAPNPRQTINWGAARAGVHVHEVGEHSLAILMGRSGPLMVSYLRGGKPVRVIRYDEYRHGLPERPDLFQPSKLARITETTTEPAALPVE